MGKIYESAVKMSENLFRNSKYVNYWPYIGKGYFNCAEKILVLGDSHYLSDVSRRSEIEKYHTLTNEVILADYLGQKYTQDFSSFEDFPKWIGLNQKYLKGYRNTANMLAHAGNQLSDYVWTNLAFFNFFQKPVADRPGSHEWLEADYNNYINHATAALDEVMQKLNPDIVLVWGKTDLFEKWTPQDKTRRYPHAKFFAINHPSYNIQSEKKDAWSNFVKANHIKESYAAHHPCYKRVEALFKSIQSNDILKPFSKWYSDRSLGFELFLDWSQDHKTVFRGDHTARLLLGFNADGSASLTLDTRCKLESFSQKIVECPSFRFFRNIRNMKCDGIFELQRFDKGAQDSELQRALLAAATGLMAFRKSNPSLTSSATKTEGPVIFELVQSIVELGKSIKDLFR